MSTEKPAQKEPHIGQTLGAPTLLETAIAARRQRGESVDETEYNKPSQIKTRTHGQNDDNGVAGTPEGGKPNRRVQQPVEEEGGSDEDRRVMDFVGNRLFGDRFKKRQEEGKEDEGGEKPPKKPEAKKGVEVTRAPRPLSADDISQIVASATTAAVRAVQPKQKPEEEQEQEVVDELDEDDRYNHEVMTAMAKRDAKYKDLPKQVISMAKQKKEYKTKWEIEHPGETFSWEDEEHEKYLDSISPTFNDRDFRRAEVAIEAEKIADSRLGEARKEMDQIEAENIKHTLGQSIEIESKKAIGDLHKEFVPMGDWDLTTESGRNKMLEEEPILGPIAVKWATILENAIGEVVRIYDGKSRSGKHLFQADAKNDMHRWIMTVVDNFEDNLSKAPVANTANEQGQTFMPRDEWSKLPPERRKRHWTIMRDQVMWLVKHAAINNANTERDQEIDRIEKISKKNGWRFNRDSVVTQRRKTLQPNDGIDSASGGEDTTGFGPESGRYPSSNDTSRIDTQRKELREGNKTFVDTMMSKLFQRDRQAS